MLEKPPSMLTSFLLGLLLIGAMALNEIHSGDLGILGKYAIGVFGFLEIIEVGVYIHKSYHFAKNVSDVSDPEVQKIKWHAEIAKEIPRMSLLQMNHHLAIINALQFPTKIDPNGIIQLLDGTEIKMSSLIKYIDGIKLESRGPSEGESVYSMKAERNADPEDRDAMRKMADEIVDHKFAVKEPGGNKSVLVTRNGILGYVDAVLAKNEVITA